MKYLIRSLKYFVTLCVICAAVMALMFLTGTSAMSLDDTLYTMMHTDRFLIMLCTIVVLSAFYPKFGFVARKIDGDIVRQRQQVIDGMRSAGFSLRSEKDGVMSFRADGLFQKLMLIGEDEILISQQGSRIVIDGIRRGVARISYRLESYLHTDDNE